MNSEDHNECVTVAVSVDICLIPRESVESSLAWREGVGRGRRGWGEGGGGRGWKETASKRVIIMAISVGGGGGGGGIPGEQDINFSSACLDSC